MHRKPLRIATTIWVLLWWFITLLSIAPTSIEQWRALGQTTQWCIGIFAVSAYLTPGTARWLFRVAALGVNRVRADRTVTVQGPATPRTVGGFGEASDRATYPADVWQRICRHEAAHAITLVMQGGTLRSIRLRRDGLAAAGVFGVFTADEAVQDHAWKSLIWSVAGHVVDIHDEGSASDLQKVWQYVAIILSTGRRPVGYHGNLAIDRLIGGARAAAQEISEQHHETLDALQEELANSDRAVLRPGNLDSLVEMLNPAEGRLTARA